MYQMKEITKHFLKNKMNHMLTQLVFNVVLEVLTRERKQDKDSKRSK